MSPLSETLTDADAGDDADAASQDDADVDKHNQAVATFPQICCNR